MSEQRLNQNELRCVLIRPSVCTKFSSTHQYYYWCYFCTAAGSKLLFNQSSATPQKPPWQR